MDRVAILKGLLESNPNDQFARYGLAMEFAKGDKFEEAVSEFRALIALNPDYVVAYYHGGRTLERLGRWEEARALYQQGIEATSRKGDAHARSEFEAALQALAGL
jgi:tetratricopeptide (TPR) repeat protein